MLKRMIRTIFGKIGYQITRIQKNKQEVPRFFLYSYLKKDGSFDYDKYRQVQEYHNKRKINSVWVIEENIAFLSTYIKSVVQSPRFGICHGTRRGKEQEWFRKYLRCEVIGTEISDTAETFPHTIQWDFHQVKPEWIDSVDFIYSNAFDHSYDPEKCLNAWMSCVRKGGICIIEHSSAHDPWGATETDPFGADIFLMPYLVTKWGKGKYGVRQLLIAPRKNDSIDHHFIVIQRFS
ncbi:MAG: methyltransferase domain-containing protein [Planctomycetota bacterium]